MATLQDLIQLIGPPVQPLHVDGDSELRAVEAYLSSALPEDYLAFIHRYGTGSFGDATFYFFIDNLQRPQAADILSSEIDYWQSCKKSFPDEYQYDIFPSRPGYLPCGGDVDGGRIGWLMNGPPCRWPVVAKSRDGTVFESYDMTLTTFLVKALTHEIRPEVWRPDFPENIADVTFVSGEQYHQRQHRAS